MAEGKRTWDKEDDLPVYFGRPGTTDQVPRQKYGGMFCNVEGAFESKTIDFDALSVGKRSSRSSKSGSKRDISQEGRRDSDQGSICTETGSGGLDEGDPGIQIKTAAGKEILQNLDEVEIMAEGKRTWDKEDDLPVYFGRPGTTDQVPRQKYGGMFCNVEGAFESKTIDFDALSVGKRSSRSSKSGSKRDISQEGRRDSDQGSICTETGSGGLDEGDPGIQIKTAAGKEILQNLDEDLHSREEDKLRLNRSVGI
ncbi:hypothetical protein EOD39_19437 [Acipenser ruthenus]|uniref:Uncharacterized protein n=1 Tax=Acipenser ruthenus TaxID=7906 RepID=A0A444UY69_ACIRT|nr:hypothetical protein EOD39_19437 [Acipenser ruthenus]